LYIKPTLSSAVYFRVADLPPRQPSDGYQILDEVQGEHSAGTSSLSTQHQSHHHSQDQQQQPGVSSTSDSDDSSSEFGKSTLQYVVYFQFYG